MRSMSDQDKHELPTINKDQREQESRAQRERMEKIGEKLLVLSGKGG